MAIVKCSELFAGNLGAFQLKPCSNSKAAAVGAVFTNFGGVATAPTAAALAAVTPAVATAWVNGQHVTVNGAKFYWDGAKWVAGVAPAPPAQPAAGGGGAGGGGGAQPAAGGGP